MTEQEQKTAEAMGAVFARLLPDGRIIGVTRMMYGKSRLTIGFDVDTYETGW